MYRSVAELETEVIRNIDEQNLDAALVLIVRFVESVITNGRATANVFGSSTLDALCQRIGTEALRRIGFPFKTQTQDKQDLVVVIATELFRTGGHTAFIEDLIKAQPERHFLILLTDLYGSCDTTAIRNRFAPLKVPVESAPSGTALEKLQWLLCQLNDLSPDRVYLLNNHQDAVAVAASHPGLENKVIFIHHGDHHLCLGVYLKGAAHVDPHNIGYFNCRNQLGLLDNRYWPLVVDDPGGRRSELSFLRDGVLRTCSSGHRSKFEAPYLYAYPDEVPKLLQMTRGVHVHIGELSPATLERIYDGMTERNIGKERFLYIPWVESLWMAMIEHRVDLYISSFPLGGGRASIEVMGSGTPMVMHESYLSRFHGGVDIAYPEVFTWREPTDLYNYLHMLTPDVLAAQGACARAHYERYHTPDRLKQELVRFETGMEGSEPVALRSYVPDKLQIYLDHAQADAIPLKKEIVHLQDTIHAQQSALDRIYGSLGWKALDKAAKIRRRIFPSQTGRGKIYDLMMRYVRVMANEGWRGFRTELQRSDSERSMASVERDVSDEPSYDLWISLKEPNKSQLGAMRSESQSWSYKPKISIITPVYAPNEYDFSECLKSVLDQTYDNWELCLVDGGSAESQVEKVIEKWAKEDGRIKYTRLSKNLGIAGNSNEALKRATGEYVAFLDHDDMLAPFALYEVVKCLHQNPSIDLMYSDEDKVPAQGRNRYDPYFKPDWSPDTMLSYNYACHFAVARKALVDELGGFREGCDGAQDHDLILRISEQTDKIHHIPKMLYHWRAGSASVASRPQAKLYAFEAGKRVIKEYLNRRGLAADVVDGVFIGSYRVKYQLRPSQRVCIIIPTRDQSHLLARCISSILAKTDYKDYELLIVDNQSREQETSDYYRSLSADSRIKVIQYDRPFNFSAINNYAVRFTDADYLVFLNNDTEVISPEWLSAMLEFSQREDVGAVGAKLYYPDGTIQHAGVIIGVGGVASHAHVDFPRSSHGYMGRINIIQNLSAVTAACMMVRRKVFEDVGGFDESMSHAFNDIDFCLKIRENGYLIVYTPYAELYHHESASRGREDTPERQARFNKEVGIMRSKWKRVFEAGDPYYNSNLTLVKEDFSLKR